MMATNVKSKSSKLRVVALLRSLLSSIIMVMALLLLVIFLPMLISLRFLVLLSDRLQR